MASAALSRRVGKVVAYLPLCNMSDLQRREFLQGAARRRHLRGPARKWQAAILKAEQNRPNLRIVTS
jgi:hypothetical protein